MTHLVRHRIESLDPFFRFLNYFDSSYFFLVLIPLIWMGFSYQWGLRIFYWFTFNSLVNSFAKNMIGWPRPSTDIPEIGMYHPTSYGFPSGAAQVCMFLGGLLIYYWRTRAAWTLGAIYILLISFSRLYLGVHYPLDILGGWAIAWLLLLLFIATKDPLENWLFKKGPIFCLILSLAIPAVIAFFAFKPSIYYIMGSTMGVGLGTYFSLQHRLFLPRPKDLNESIGRFFTGIVLLSLIVFLWPGGPSVAQSFTAGLFMSLAASPICKWCMDRKI